MTTKKMVPLDDHWKSADSFSDPHCHEWQHGAHIDSMPKQGTTMTAKEQRLRAALIKLAWCADAGRQFRPGTEDTMRDLLKNIRDMAWEAVRQEDSK